MIFPVKRLMIDNDGYRRNISLKTIYINSASIISISDYHGISDFLLREKSDFSENLFSLVRLNNTTDDIIVLGTAEEVYSQIQESQSGKQILND